MTATRRKLTDQELADKEYVQTQKLLEQASSWDPTAPHTLRGIAEGEIKTPKPELFFRDDDQTIIYPARTHLFLGEPESCKTWCAMILIAQEILEGNAAIYVDIEDQPATAIERLLQLGLTADEIADGFIYVQPEEFFDDVAAAHIDHAINMSALQDRTVTVAVVDSMTEAMALQNLDPDRGLDVSKFYQSLPKCLVRNGVAVVVIDHVTKNTSGRGKWAIGSERKISGLTGAAFKFECANGFGRGMTGTVKVSLSKDRAGSLRPLCGAKPSKTIGTIELKSDDAGNVTYSFKSPGETKQGKKDDYFTRMRNEIIQVISEDDGIGVVDLRKTVTGDNGLIDDTIELLIKENVIYTEKTGHKTGHYLVVTS